MKKYLLLVSICIIPFVLCDGEHDIPIEPTIPPPTNEPSSTSSTMPPMPPKTTTPTTTTKTTPTTTPTSTTPTTTTTSTTPKPPKTTTPTTTTTTTTTTSPTTSTIKPTPTPKPTVPPTPTPTPEPTMGKWSVNFTKSNMSCILLDAATQIELLHPNATSIKMNVPTNATSIGDCKGNQTIILTWADSKVNVSLQFEFSKQINATKFELEAITCNMTKDNSSHSLHHRRSEFITPLANSYKCARVQTLNLTDDKNNTAAYLHISHLQLQAYGNSSSHNFASAKDCDESITSDVIPIVVGCVLAILVIAVLGAYLVGRRRCQARGYLSMFTESEKDTQEEELIPMKSLSCFK